MRQTLFLIPDEIAGLAMFGPIGWLSFAWVLFAIGLMLYLVRTYGWQPEVKGYLPVLGMVWLVVAFGLPMMVESGGIPIRGYGVMLLAGTVCGVGLAAWRAKSLGLDPEVVLSLSFWVFVSAIAGARAFYVIEYWHQFQRPNVGEMLLAIVNVTQGGLVVYGAFVAGSVVGVGYLLWRKMNVLAIADLVAPSVMLGLALGRLGCLLNGCCYGGLCDNPWAYPITFPGGPTAQVESPPYSQHRERGLLQGITIEENEAGLPIIGSIDQNGPAAKTKLKPGQTILYINKPAVHSGETARTPLFSAEQARRALRIVDDTITLETQEAGVVTWSLPPRSRPVYPTQIYSALNAFFIFLVGWFAYAFRPREGFITALILTCYPVTRTLLEIIRNDEPPQWGSALTISQWVSVGVILFAVGLWVFLWRKAPRQLTLPVSTPSC